MDIELKELSNIHYQNLQEEDDGQVRDRTHNSLQTLEPFCAYQISGCRDNVPFQSFSMTTLKNSIEWF